MKKVVQSFQKFSEKTNFEMSVQTQHKPERVKSSARHTAVKFQERLLKYANQLTTAKVTAGIGWIAGWAYQPKPNNNFSPRFPLPFLFLFCV